MKIENIKINSFGKLKNKDINLSNGINIIYGKNEAGKSTIMKFIQNIFYGTSKNKKGKNFSDYELYKPWDTEDFSGKITYKLDNNKKYEVFREFGKKNPKIYNENLEDITKNFDISKVAGSDFFFEQTGIDEFMFLSSIVSMQKEVKLNEQDQNIYIQKIANLVTTGDDSISFKKAIEKLNKKQLEEIGTDRSIGKPINIIKKEILDCNTKLEELQKYKNEKFKLENEEQELLKEIEQNKIKISFIKELQEIKQEEKIELEKLKLNEQMKEKNDEQIANMEKEIENFNLQKKRDQDNKDNTKNIKFKLYMLIFIVCTLIGISFFIFLKNNIITLISCIIDIIIWTVYFINKNKISKKIEEQKNEIIKHNLKIDDNISILKNKIELVKNNNIELLDQIKKITTNIEMQLDLKKENLKAKFINKLSVRDINNMIDSYDLNNIRNSFEDLLQRKQINLNMVNLEKRKSQEGLEEYVSLKEKMDLLKEKYQELIVQNDKINIVKELIKNAYDKMKNNITPKFTKNFSEIIKQISNQKYSNVYINDTQGIIVLLPNGEYVEAEKLSCGTIEQLYLSLRLSMAKELSKENMPIILDESFAYYDDERLENTLKFLKNYFDNNQIIIFTCTNREKNLLDKVGYEYNYINL